MKPRISPKWRDAVDALLCLAYSQSEEETFLPETYLPSDFAQPRSRDGSTTSMPDIGIPGHRSRNDTGVGSQSGSSDSLLLTVINGR
ncbi:hypothetical protein OUZ56_021333 [Daphnia magna]|uniref:Uncharacterized protein n=1 Tax=Daphnia magna TaxID=35525 RepID=A0ABQ9ZH51_9CRUS|nr:hypothetical protein OUZ56_021333 [Daphnia magna]